MTVTLIETRRMKILNKCGKLVELKCAPIRLEAELIGLFVASFQGVEFAPLYYRCLDIDKTKALKCQNGNFDAVMHISKGAKSDILWWIQNLHGVLKPIRKEPPIVFFASDASKLVWGG